MGNKKIVVEFLEGFNSPEKIGKSISLLANDYKFKGPMSEARSKDEFLELAEGMADSLTGLQITRIMEDGDWVSVCYEFTTSLPGLEKTVGSEWFRLESGTIKESYLIYDATGFRKLYEGININ